MNNESPVESRKMAVVGMFDGVHRGHISLIAELKRLATARGLVPMAFTFTYHPLTLIAPQKCPQMLSTVDERCALLRAAGVSETVALDFGAVRSLTARGFLAMIRDRYRVDALLMGFNNHIGSDRFENQADYVAAGVEAGVEVLFADEYRGEGAPCSSFAVRADISAGRVEDAAMRLGRPYAISGTVVSGRQLGRTIGFPTANIQSDGRLLPAAGVYSADTEVEGRRYRTVVNVGHRPTVDAAEAPITVEAHLMGYAGDLYGRRLRIELLRRLRDERKFASVDDLAQQIRLDVAAASD